MGLLQAAIAGLMALIVTPGFLFYFDVTPKIAVLLAGTGLCLFFAAAIRPAHRLFSLLLLLNAVSLAVSTAFSSDFALSVFGTNWRRFGAVPEAAVLLFAWLVAQHTAERPDRARAILRGVAISGGLSAMYGIAQYFGWDPLLPKAAYHIGEGIWMIVRPPGTMGYVSYFATWLVAVSFLSMALRGLETSVVWRSLAASVAVLAAIAMVLTGTRAAVLGLAAGAALWLWRYRSGFRITRRIVVAAALIVAASTAFYFSPPGWRMRSRMHWVREDRWGGARLLLWRDSLRMAAHRPAAGYGPEVFTAAFPRFESKALAESYPDFLYESPHNIFLDALISQGLPGLVILAALCFAGLRKAGDSPAVRWLAAGIAAQIVTQQFTTFTAPTAAIFYVTLALAAGFASKASASGARVLPFRVAAAPVAAALFYLAARFTVADRDLALSRRAVEMDDLSGGAQYYARYGRWRLPGTSADLWYSRALLNVAMHSPAPLVRFQALLQSGVAGLRATKNAEDPFDAWYSLAEVYAARNDPSQMEASLRAAIAARPNWFKPHWALAQLLRMESRMDEAEGEAALAAELNAGKHPEVAQTLAEIRAQRAAARKL